MNQTIEIHVELKEILVYENLYLQWTHTVNKSTELANMSWYSVSERIYPCFQLPMGRPLFLFSGPLLPLYHRQVNFLGVAVNNLSGPSRELKPGPQGLPRAK